MSGRQAHWDRVHRTKAEDVVSWFEADVSEHLALIARHAPDRAAALLDVGAGLTRLIPALMAAGYRDVSVLDVSAEAVARAKARPGVEGAAWIIADVAHWTPERRYRLWHDRAVLHFLTEAADRTGYARALERATEPGSIVMMSAFAPDGPAMCSGLPVRRYGRAEFEAFLGAGFETLEAFASVHLTPAGAEQRFQTHVARRLR